MADERRDLPSPPGDFYFERTQPPTPAEGQLAYESTFTAPTEWVPYVYTDAEIHRLANRRGLTVASLICGALGLLIAVFGVWGAPLSLAAVILALVARSTERLARPLGAYGLVTGLIGLVLAAGWIVFVTQVLPSWG